MKSIYCHKCKTLIATLVAGSKIRKGAIHFCADCFDTGGFEADLFSFLRGHGKKRPGF